ncbi:MAG TPA: carboxypeptidase regulatory-like domain-containing protein [Pyrinomonadaceae bacterium]|nr:carboxypeptidase regulatory-like domain-containing protein [Pyrinomonadaceae bacterium]
MKTILKQIASIIFIAAILFILFVVVSRGQPAEDIVAAGGTFILQKTVTASGGTDKQMQPLGENGTTGQAIAGHRSTGSQYTLYSGFWTPEDLAPTAAMATVSGRIATAEGAGITNVIVTLTSPSGTTRSTRSTTFGNYQFADVEVGGTYFITVSSRRFTFAQPTQVRTVMDNVSDVDFIANAINP